MSSYSKDDVQTHYGSDRPAVNVKVYDSLADGYRKFRAWDTDADEGFTLDWIEENVSETALDSIFWNTCEWEYEYLEGWATKDDDAIFPGSSLERDGRGGGWVVVRGLDDIEDWDAVALAKWRKFERVAKSIADDIMAKVVETIYINEWEYAVAETAESERAANQGIATSALEAR